MHEHGCYDAARLLHSKVNTCRFRPWVYTPILDFVINCLEHQIFSKSLYRYSFPFQAPYIQKNRIKVTNLNESS